MKAILSLGMLLTAGAVAGALAQAPMEAIRGEVVQREDNTLQVKSATAQTRSIQLPDSVRVSVRAPSTLDAVRAGAFVGVTAAPRADGTLVASEVHIFPEAMRGTGEGHRPMSTRSGSTMTKAAVASVADARSKPGNTMTNVTVAGMTGADGTRAMRLVYAGGERTILVPSTTPIVTIEPGNLSSLVPGAHVIVYATGVPGEHATAQRISIGKDGSVPPI